MESSDLAPSVQSALGVCLDEADTPLEEGVPAAGPSNVEKVGTGVPSGAVTTSTPPPKSTGAEPNRKWLPD